ncbi:MAG: hypothetical protein ABIE94_06905 [archaeon]
MAGINGIVLFIIGGVMAVYARFVASKTDNALMSVFFWVGMVIAIIGVLKILVGSKKKNKEQTPKGHPQHGISHEEMKRRASKHNKKKGKHNPRLQQHFQPTYQQHPQYPQQIQRAQQPAHMSIIMCRGCGTRHYPNANYCQACGARLK